MSNNKLLYEAPVAEALVVRFEGRIMTVSGQNEVYQSSGTYTGEWEDED